MEFGIASIRWNRDSSSTRPGYAVGDDVIGCIADAGFGSSRPVFLHINP
jgi:hypothetical protein